MFLAVFYLHFMFSPNVGEKCTFLTLILTYLPLIFGCCVSDTSSLLLCHQTCLQAKKNKPVVPFVSLALDKETSEINQSYNAIKRSIYHRHVARWLHWFSLQQLHVVDGDHMIVKPWEEMRKVSTCYVLCF